MPDTGWVLTGTCTNFTMPGSTGANWVNLSNATVIDSNYAHVNQTAIGDTNAIRASNFDFSGIPTGAHIDGIEILMDGLHRTGVIASIDFTNIVNPDGTRNIYDITIDPANTSITPTDTTGGGSNDRLSTALTVADVQDTDFGFLTNVTTSTTSTIEMRIESMQMRITYHEGFPAPIGSAEQMGGGKKGPFLYNGYVYALVTRTTPGTNEQALQIARTQTPEKGNWVVLDTGTTSEMTITSPTLLYADAFAAQVINNLLHIVRISSDGLGSRIHYRRFNLSTNTWVTTADETWINNVDILAPAVDIHCISASDIYVVYSGEVDRVMGGDKLRVDYAHWNGTAWTTGQALDNAGDVHYGSPVVCEGNGADDVHFAWLRQTSTANDPPNDWADVQGRTHLGSGGLNGTWDTFTFSSITAGGIGVSLRALTRDAGTIRAYLAENTSGDLGFVLGTETGANNVIDFTSDAQDTDTISIDTNARSIIVEDQWVFDAIYDPITSKYYMVHSDPATDDLYYRESVDGTSWNASVEILDGVTRCDDISINVYTRGIDTVLAVLYTDNEVTFYTEHVVQAGILPFYGQVNDARRRNTLLRM